MRTIKDPCLERGQQPVSAFKRKWDLWNESKINVLARDRCPGSNEAGVPPHYFDKGNAVFDTACFRGGPVQSSRCFLDSREITKTPGYEGDVVIHCLGNADDRQWMAAMTGFLKERIT